MQHGAKSLCHTHANEIFTWLQRSFINNQSQGSFGHSDGWWYVCMPLYDFHIQLPKHCDASSNIFANADFTWCCEYTHLWTYVYTLIRYSPLNLKALASNKAPALVWIFAADGAPSRPPRTASAQPRSCFRSASPSPFPREWCCSLNFPSASFKNTWLIAGVSLENTAEDTCKWKLLPLEAVKLFKDCDRTSPAWVTALAGAEDLRSSWSWLAVVPADPPPTAPSREATRTGEKTVFTEVESERRAWYNRRPRVQLVSPGGGGGGRLIGGGFFPGESATLPCVSRTGRNIRAQTGILGNMADLKKKHVVFNRERYSIFFLQHLTDLTSNKCPKTSD